MKLETKSLLRLSLLAAALALLWGLPELTDVSLVTRLILSAYLVIGARLEERKLIERYGEPYRAYRRRVPMFFPWKRGR